MKASELISKLKEMVAERGDLELFTFAGEEGLEPRLTVKFIRVREAHAADYFGEDAIESDEEKLRGDGIQGLGSLYPAAEDEPHVLGIYIGL